MPVAWPGCTSTEVQREFPQLHPRTKPGRQPEPGESTLSCGHKESEREMLSFFPPYFLKWCSSCAIYGMNQRESAQKRLQWFTVYIRAQRISCHRQWCFLVTETPCEAEYSAA